MIFDSHAHLNFEAFQDDYKKVIDDCQNSDIWMVNVGSQYDTSTRAVEIAKQYTEGVYASIGIHPVHAHTYTFDAKHFKKLFSASSKIVAIGECGIDFFHTADTFDIQKEIFIQQIRFAKENDLALIVHGRNSKDGSQNSYEEIMKIVKEENIKRAVIHCFGGSEDEVKQFLDLGFYIGFTGIVTFKNAPGLQHIASYVVPIEQMLIETDCPYLSPDPYRGKRNQPQYVEFVAKKIAELKKISYNKIVEKTSQNALRFFGL